jgi:hypothetical protein
VASFTPAASADVCAPADTTAGYADRFNDLATEGCFGGSRDKARVARYLQGEGFMDLVWRIDTAQPRATAPIAAAIRQASRDLRDHLLDQTVPDPLELQLAHRSMLQLLSELERHADALIAPGPEAAQGGPGSLAALGDLRNYPSPNEKDPEPVMSLHNIVPGAERVIPTDYLDRNCPATATRTPDCDAALEYLGAFHRVARLARMVVYQGIVRLRLQAIQPQADALDRSWQAYFDQARSQTILEYLVNGWIWHRDSVRQQGFPPPPTWQLILLHPGVSLEYADVPRDADRFKPAVHLEVLGINRWGYEADGAMRSALGFSLGLLYADREDTRDTRALLQIHYRNRYSLGITYGDGDTGVVLSADLLKLGTGLSGEWRDRFMTARGLFD